MSRQLINRSADLSRLVDDGYEVDVRHGHLVMSGVPYVTSTRAVRLGTLISPLELAGDVTARPSDHVVHFAGEYPCRADGSPITQITHQSSDQTLAPGIVSNHSFSSKPASGYTDYHHKMTSYAAILVSQAQAIDENATAQTYRVIEATDPDSPFVYIDNASSRVGIAAITEKLRLRRIAVFGLGGSGGYILDQLAKLPIGEIALYDGDRMLQHNAFRAPGAVTLEELRARPFKVDYYRDRYSAMHRNIVAHPHFIERANVAEIGAVDFAFISMDPGDAKLALVEYLEGIDAPFIDVGMGVEIVDEALVGQLRVSVSLPGHRKDFRERVSFAEPTKDDLYAKNIQIADLNALNAIIAVARFKRHFGFYADLENELFSRYATDGNHLLNEAHR